MPERLSAVHADRHGVGTGSSPRPAPTRDAEHGRACGNFAVNTIQPASQPYSGNGPFIPLIDDAKYPEHR